jgi:hypothetical protein
MSKIHTVKITSKNLKQLREIIAGLIVRNYVAGNATVAADRILKLFVVKENSLKSTKK